MVWYGQRKSKCSEKKSRSATFSTTVKKKMRNIRSPRRLKYFLVTAFREDVGFSACVHKILPPLWINLHGLHYCVPHTKTLFSIPLWCVKKTNDYWKSKFLLADVTGLTTCWMVEIWFTECAGIFFPLCHGFHGASLVQHLFSRSRK